MRMIHMPRRVAETGALAILLTIVLLGGSAFARKRRSVAQSSDFSYYLLTLSWAPDFCALPNIKKDPVECGPDRQVGFVVHGLWPQAEQGRGPENCGPASPVSRDIVRVMLNYMPSASLIQHEWSAHGTCSGLSTADYFAAVRKARDSVNIPPEFKNLSQTLQLAPPEIDVRFAAANPAFPSGAFHASCSNRALREERICFTRGAAPSPRECPESLPECSSPNVLIRPLR
jgi:ribonuclease T2